MAITVLSDRTPKARKMHQCLYCCGWIVPGERYHRQVNIYDGDFGVVKLHPECWKAHLDSGEEEIVPGEHKRPLKNRSNQ